MSPAVLHVAQPTDGGVARYVAAVAADQRARGWSVAVACPPTGGDLPAWLASSDVPSLHWPAGRGPGPGTPGEARRLSQIIRTFDPNLVHLHSSTAGLAGRLVMRGRMPTLFQPHGWSWLAATGAARRAALAWERAAAGWADRIVCVSDRELDAGRRAGVTGALTVVRNGTDVARLRPLREKTAGSGGLIAVCVGRLTRQKGQDRLLAAWSRVRTRHPDATLALVGDGPDRAALERHAPPGVSVTGHLDDVTPYLAAADLVVLPSRWEGLSLAMLEALAAGRPVVTTRVAGSEIVAPGAGWVLSADPGDDAAITKELESLLDDLLGRPEALVAAGRVAGSLADAQLDIKRMYDELAELTERTANQR